MTMGNTGRVGIRFHIFASLKDEIAWLQNGRSIVCMRLRMLPSSSRFSLSCMGRNASSLTLLPTSKRIAQPLLPRGYERLVIASPLVELLQHFIGEEGHLWWVIFA